MKRRHFPLQILCALALPLAGRTAEASNPWDAIERRSGGRLGVAVLQAGGRLDGHRLDERFPMCSTFKWLLAAHVLRRVERGEERLDRRIAYGREALVSYSPITAKHVGQGMTIGELCHAAVTVSDNAAANLLLDSFGGPPVLTRHARSVGDEVTRLDRRETMMSEGRPSDPRDTTSPRAMAKLLQAHLVGNALSPASREQLARWMEATETNTKRLKAHLPAGWRLGSKTGTGGFGSTNDVGVFWPPGKPPIVVAAYLTQTKAAEDVRARTIAEVGRIACSG